jgi:hypothetical protein
MESDERMSESSKAATSAEDEPLLLREWNSPSSAPAQTTPVAPAVVIPSPEPSDRRASSVYTYPVATFVRDLVRTGMDQIESWQQEVVSAHDSTQNSASEELPLSVRSEADAQALGDAAAAALAASMAMVSARTVNDMDDNEDAEFILVDGELVMMTPPPPNPLEQRGIEYRLHEQRFHDQLPKSCQPSRVRRGVRKLGKLFKRKPGLRRATSKESAAQQQA